MHQNLRKRKIGVKKQPAGCGQGKEGKKVLIWAGLLLDATALAINALWLVKLIRSAGEEVRKRRKDGRDYTRYSSYYGYYLRSAVLGANIGALVCMLLRVCSKL